MFKQGRDREWEKGGGGVVWQPGIGGRGGAPLLSPQIPRLLLPWTMLTAKYARAGSTNIKCSFVTYVMQDGIWTTCSHPSPLSQLGFGNAPYGGCGSHTHWCVDVSRYQSFAVSCKGRYARQRAMGVVLVKVKVRRNIGGGLGLESEEWEFIVRGAQVLGWFKEV